MVSRLLREGSVTEDPSLPLQDQSQERAKQAATCFTQSEESKAKRSKEQSGTQPHKRPNQQVTKISRINSSMGKMETLWQALASSPGEVLTTQEGGRKQEVSG